MKRILLALSAAALMGLVACYLPVEIQCTADADCIGGATCVNDRCTCPAGRATQCGTSRDTTRCVDIRSDSKHCGGCDKEDCGSDRFCGPDKDGVIGCQQCDKTTGKTDCRDADGATICVDTINNPNHCGGCGIVCKGEKTCQKKEGEQTGECKCPEGSNDCGSTCKDLQTDPKNCGSCDKECTGNENVCSAAKCIECPKSTTQPLCPSGACPILASDRDHCGKCGNTCAAGEECCNSKCVDPKKAHTTITDCGSCGKACGADNTCEDIGEGKFDCVCKTKGEINCDGKCLDVNTSTDHCGSCGNKCDAGDICSEGICCGKDQLSCGTPRTCKSVKTDVNNCGKCDEACGAQICKDGSCQDCTSDADCGGGLTCTNKVCVCGPKCGWIYSTASVGETSKTGLTEATGVVVDKAGNTYVIGHYTAQTRFDAGGPEIKPTGSGDIFVLKLSPSGKYIWAKTFGGSELDLANGIALTQDEKSVLVVGTYSAEIVFDAGATPPVKLTSAGGVDIFLLALTTSGKVEYAVSAGGTTDDDATSISVNATHAYITGKTSDKAKFSGNTIVAAGLTDILMVARFDLGTKAFDKAVGIKSSRTTGDAITVSSGDDVFVSGKCGDPIPWAANPDLCAQTSGIFALRLDKDLVETADGSSSRGGAQGTGIAMRGTKAVFTGFFNGNVLFESAFEAKLTDGLLTGITGKTFDGTTQFTPVTAGIDLRPNGIAAFQNSVFPTGQFTGSPQLKTALTNNGAEDIFIGEYDNNNTWKWAISAGGPGVDIATGVATTVQGGVVIVGYFSGEVKNFKDSAGEVTLKTTGAKEMFVWKVPIP